MARTRSIEKSQAARRPSTLSCKTSKGSDTQSSLAVNSNNTLAADGADGKLFKSLSLEIHQMIIDLLPDDSDVAHYAQICFIAGAAVTTSVWRKRFLRKYDQGHGEGNGVLFKKYKYRHIVSNEFTIFNLKRYNDRLSIEAYDTQLFNQKNWLDLLRTLIIESDARKVVDEKGCEVIEGRNIKFICDVISDTRSGNYIDIIDATLNTVGYFNIEAAISANKSGTLVFVVQLILTSISLHPDFCNARVSHFDLSQGQAYATSEAQPIFTGTFLQHINVMWLLNVVNFFKFHLKTTGEGLLSHEYGFLERNQYPQPWVGRIKAGTEPLGAFWKGCHTYMEENELFRLRNRKANDIGIYSDSLDLRETFQDIEIFSDESQFPSHIWPAAWERSVLSNPFQSNSSSRSHRRSKRNIAKMPEILNFYGISEGDNKTGYFYGRVHSIPHQQGFHGFQRITFVLCYYPEQGPTFDQIAYSYEGCVLPGGRFIVGRWWDFYADPKDIATMSGPFIWWNVDKRTLDRPGDPDDIKNFLRSYVE